MKLNEFIASRLPVLEDELRSRAARREGGEPLIWDAMGYSLLAGGKRIRPLMLQLAACAAAGGITENVLRDTLPYACAIEMIHTYSLIHDDLPAMDNDDYRRGRLTNHKVYGEAVAILAGDGLLNLAYETLFEALRENASPCRVRAASVIAAAAGPSGMVAGQMADIIETLPMNRYEERFTRTPAEEASRLEYIERNKTGQMLAAALRAGAETQGASQEDCEAMQRAGFLFGRAFQIEDDLLDVEGSREELGKSTGKDASQQKLTFVSIYGMEEARRIVRDLSGEAVGILGRWDNEPARLLAEWIEQMIYRTK